MAKENLLERRMFILDNIEFNIIRKGVKSKLEESAKKEGINLQVDFFKKADSLPEGYDAYILNPDAIKDLKELKCLKEKQPWCKIYLFSDNPVGISDKLKSCIDDYVLKDGFYDPRAIHHKTEKIIKLLKQQTKI